MTNTTQTYAEPLPAPWDLKGRSWVFALPPLAKGEAFPPGWAAEYQVNALSSGGKFIGGLGALQLVSYTESPAGPYDELIYSPGRWEYPDGTKAFRITRIWVSNAASTVNGRRNWNIPKGVANFNYKQDPTTQIWSLSVSNHTTGVPFFRATFSPIPFVSKLGFPYSSNVIPIINIVQPPVPQGPEEVDVESSDRDGYAALTPGMKGSMSLGMLSPALLDKRTDSNVPRFGNGVEFPDVKPYSLGVHAQEFFLEFPIAEWLHFDQKHELLV